MNWVALTLVLVARAAAPEPATAERAVALEAILSFAAERPSLAALCLAHGGSDPSGELVASLRARKLKVLPFSKCPSGDAGGVVVVHQSLVWKAAGAVRITIERRHLPDRELYESCTYPFSWRKGRWVADQNALCNVY